MRRVLLSIAAAALAAAAVVVACRRTQVRPNLLLVTIETFRADHLGARRDGVALTPRLDALAARGTRFDRAYAAASFTLPSLHTIATGEPPPVHGVRFWTQFGNRFVEKTLAERLRDEGYRTALIDAVAYSMKPYPILQRGWDEPPAEFVEDPHATTHGNADEALAAAKSWLDRNRGSNPGEPFFLWVHLIEPHTPYAPAERFAEGLADLAAYRAAGPATFPVQEWADRVPGGKGPSLADALYAAEVRAADDVVGRLLDDLEGRGLAAKTIVCVAADHGENLSSDPEPRWDHGVSCDEQLIHVPMIWAGPGVPAGAVDAKIARHLDVAPTLLRFAGIDAPVEWIGRDLFGTAPAPALAVSECTVYANVDGPMYSVTDGSTSLRLFSAVAPWGVELRDETQRGSRRTPVNLSQPSPAAAAHAAAWKAESESGRHRAADPGVNAPGTGDGELTEAQKRVLAGPGYMGGGGK